VIRLAGAAIEPEAIGIDPAKRPALQGRQEDPEDIFATSDAVKEEGWRGGCRGPCSGSLRAAPSNGSAGLAALGGSHAVLPWWAFTFLWASPTVPVRRPWSREGDGAGGTLAASRPPARFFSPGPRRPSYATFKAFLVRSACSVGSALCRPSTGRLWRSRGPQALN